MATMMEINQLYLELSEKIAAKQAAGEPVNAAFMDTLDALDADFNDKLEIYSRIDERAEGRLAVIDRKLKDLQAEKKRLKSMRDGFQYRTKQAFAERGIKDYTTPDGGIIKLKKTKGRIVANVHQLPDGFKREVTKTTYQADTDKIRAALEAGQDVPGAELIKDKIKFL